MGVPKLMLSMRSNLCEDEDEEDAERLLRLSEPLNDTTGGSDDDEDDEEEDFLTTTGSNLGVCLRSLSRSDSLEDNL